MRHPPEEVVIVGDRFRVQIRAKGHYVVVAAVAVAMVVVAVAGAAARWAGRGIVAAAQTPHLYARTVCSCWYQPPKALLVS